MMKLTVDEIREACGGRLYAPDASSPARVVEGLTWDSREVRPDMAFLGLAGARVDGNDFISQAVKRGAGAIIATREPSDAQRAVAGEFSCPLVIVEDGPRALMSLASLWRGRLSSVVLGITGSTGKTSTKDLVRAVLSQRYGTCATQGNHNNELGVPATVLSADEKTEALVVEMGMRGLGQIEDLCKAVRPSIGIVTNIGVSHLELLGSQDAIARAKSELLQALPADGLAILNADDPSTPRLRELGALDARGVETRTFGRSDAADVRAAEVSLDSLGCASFELVVRGASAGRVRLSMPGEHNVMNALAAACAGDYLGLGSAELLAGLAEATGSAMRMQVQHSASGITVVNDAYNANPDSMRAALGAFAAFSCAGRRIAVLGDMGELGEREHELHASVGAVAAGTGLDLLVCVGTLARDIAAGALDAGMDARKVVSVADVDEALAYLAGVLSEGDLVLVKASRSMGLERIAKGIAD